MNCFEQIEIFKDEYRENLPKPYPTWPPKVKRAVIWIHRFLFAQKLTVHWMKKKSHVNGKSFAAQFAFCTRFKPKSYILHHRINAGKQLLNQTEATVTMVALSIGFTSLSSFDKAFESRVGVCPSVWRKQRMGMRARKSQGIFQNKSFQV